MTDDEIKNLRKKLDWSQDQLAEFLGVDRSTVSRMEGGQSPSGAVRKLLEQLKADAKRRKLQSESAP